jgi:5'-nucleotidase
VSDDVWTIAPEVKRSSMGHSISLHEAFTLRQLGPRRYACSGTPADCAIAGMAWIFAETDKPDLVLSGVNDGRNIGEDVVYSGTLSIAREAAFWGIPAISFSAPNKMNFDAPEMASWLADVVRGLACDMDNWHLPDEWLSINLPSKAPAPLRHAVPGRAKIAGKIVAESKDGQSTVLRYLKGRTGVPVPGDEATLLDAGFATIYRLRWNGYARLEDAFLDKLNSNTSGVSLNLKSDPK